MNKHRLAAIVYSTGNEQFTRVAVDHLRQTVDYDFTDIYVIDNGSEPPFSYRGDYFIRYEKNVGGNAVFHRWRDDDWFGKYKPDILAFFHCDLFVHEKNWDRRVVGAFDNDQQLALLGFVGSNEIDERGGRGGGTMLNYAGQPIADLGVGSAAEVHGRRETGLAAAAVVDHCAMIFRRTMLEQLTPQEGNYAPEHFYDRLLSCEVIERGWRVAVMGVSVDHFSGGIGPGMTQADELRREWLEREGIAYDPQDSYTAVYRESEQRFFERYRKTRFFPFRVESDYTVVR